MTETMPGQGLLLELLPLAQIEEDPNQPRKHFTDEDLGELAGDIEDAADGDPRPWETGLLHPIVVYRRPGAAEGEAELRFRILSGARRFRAYQLRNWPAIPARIVPSPRSAARALMTQLIENRSRKDTTLFEDAAAVQDAWDTWRVEHPAGKLKDFAAEFRKSPSWVSRHLAVMGATGLARLAAIEGHIRRLESHRLFCQLPYELQRELLRQARATEMPISAQLVKSLLPKKRPRRKGGGPTAGSRAGAEAEAAAPREPLTLRLRLEQVRWLLEQLGFEVPKEERYLEAALIAALNPEPGSSAREPVSLRLRFPQARRLLKELGADVPDDDSQLEAALQTTLHQALAA